MNSQEWRVLYLEDPENELLLFSYAKALLDEKAWEPAARAFAQLTEQKPDYVMAWAFLARACLENGQREEARRAVEKGLPLARNFGHEIPVEELEAVLEELDSEF